MLLFNSDFGWTAFTITLKVWKIPNENFIINWFLICPLHNPQNDIVAKLTVSWGFYKTNKHLCIEFHMFLWHSFRRTTIKNKTAVGNKTHPKNLLRYEKLIVNMAFLASCGTVPGGRLHGFSIMLKQYYINQTAHHTKLTIYQIASCLTMYAQLLNILPPFTPKAKQQDRM